MVRVLRLMMVLVGVAAVLGLAVPSGAQADPEDGAPYIYVSKQVPERLYLIDGGKIVFESPANTGIRVSPTPNGEFRVFASFVQRTMKGTDPVTFKPYNDPNVPYAMYFDGGRAIHGFPRHGYGYPQSFGCVELPVSKARQLFGMLQGGMDTEVVVSSHPPVLAYPGVGRPAVQPVMVQNAPPPAAPYPAAAPYPTGSYPTASYPTASYPTGSYPVAPYPAGAYPAGSYPAASYAAARYPAASYPAAPYPADDRLAEAIRP